MATLSVWEPGREMGKGSPRCRGDPFRFCYLPLTPYAVKLLPQPQPPVAFGLWNVKPAPCIEET